MNNPALDYAFDVLAGQIPACRYIRLACQRFMDDLNNPEFWYDEAAAEKFYDFCSYAKHYKGPQKGQPIHLEPWEKFLAGNVYGFKRCRPATEDDLIAWGDDDDQGWGERLRELYPDGFDVGEFIKTDILRFHYNYLEVPRKNGKTTLAALMAAYDAAFLEDTGAEVYCLATKEEQAQILWRDVRAFIKQSEDLTEVFEVLEGRNTIYTKDSSRTSYIKPLGSNSDTLDGLNPISAVCDELHEWPDRALLDVIEDAFGARINWHVIQITTAGKNKQGICYTERKHGIDILEGRFKKDDKLVLIYTVDEEDVLDNGKVSYTRCLTDQTVWFKANPNLGTGKQLDYMVTKAEKASQIPSELTTFLNKQLNIWTDAAEIWLKWEVWKQTHRDYKRALLRGKKCFLGGDLGKVDDMSAIVYWFPVQPGLDKVHVLVDFYCPSDNIATRVKMNKWPYDVWVREGWVKETPGNTTDYKFIAADILKAREEFEIEWGCFDRTFGGELIQTLMEEGMEILTAGQGFMSMGPACDELERLIIKQEIVTNHNPVLDWNSANVVVVKDPADNKKPDKVNSPGKIDGIVAMLNVVIGILAKSKKEPPKKGANKIYEKRGLRNLNSEDEPQDKAVDERIEAREAAVEAVKRYVTTILK